MQVCDRLDGTFAEESVDGAPFEVGRRTARRAHIRLDAFA
jgi:hypothetical protein